jgi:uncharacterized membrane protein
VLVDMASIEGLYRILAFLVLGSLMIGVSYVYHRVEKRLLGEVAATANSKQHANDQGEV